MSSVQCHFCSRSNPADAKFCSGCLGQLNLAPCPHCDGVNEVTAAVCHSCKAELRQALVERSSRGSEQVATEAAPSKIDTRSLSATRSTDSGELHGSSRDSRMSTENAASSKFECVGGSIRDGYTDAFKADRAPGTRDSTQPDETRSQPSKGDLTSNPASNPAEVGRLRTDAVASRLYANELGPENPKIRVDRLKAAFAKNAVATFRAALGLLKRIQASFRRRRIAVVVGVGLFVAVGVLVYGVSRSPVHLTSAVPPEVSGRATPEKQNAPSDASVQGNAAGGRAESATACNSGAAALGLCPSEPAQAQPATQVESSSEVARSPAKDRATGGCKEGIFALGLCGD